MFKVTIPIHKAFCVCNKELAVLKYGRNSYSLGLDLQQVFIFFIIIINRRSYLYHFIINLEVVPWICKVSALGRESWRDEELDPSEEDLSSSPRQPEAGWMPRRDPARD